ncbi:MAG: imidazole glycerol phosphate synthase subunit HisH [Verrucomicrobia bacterium]|nr:imidazole glycerol phosphate synthase subunit HisH [Verrucomicrobiota bacterium]
MKPKLAVIDYGMGNLRSVSKAFEACGAEVTLVTGPEQVNGSAGLILPGVGALGDCIEGLRACNLIDTVKGWIAEDRPFFGVCLGFQALYDYSEEGSVKGLGIFPGQVKRFQLPDTYKVPHMGWNSVTFADTGDSIVEGLNSEEDQFYFVHSYYVAPEEALTTFFQTDYGSSFASGIKVGNCVATQFHPEKSQKKGLTLYRNFLKLVENN